MRKKLFITTLLFCIIFSSISHARLVEDEQKEIPPYAKWGQMAMKETFNRYPNICIVDYLHMGREVGPTQSTEKFKLWLRACPSKQEFGVYIRITFDNKTEDVNAIDFQETDR